MRILDLTSWTVIRYLYHPDNARCWYAVPTAIWVDDEGRRYCVQWRGVSGKLVTQVHVNKKIEIQRADRRVLIRDRSPLDDGIKVMPDPELAELEAEQWQKVDWDRIPASRIQLMRDTYPDQLELLLADGYRPQPDGSWLLPIPFDSKQLRSTS